MNTIYNSTIDKQIGQRSKFALALNICKPLTAFLRVGYKNYTTKQTSFNAAMSYILANAITGEYPNYGIDMNKVLVSRGNLTGAINGKVSVRDTSVWICWDNQEENDSDVAMIAILNLEKEEAFFITNGNCRENELQELNLPKDWKNNTVSVFLSFISADKTNVSDSSYLGDYNLTYEPAN